MKLHIDNRFARAIVSRENQRRNSIRFDASEEKCEREFAEKTFSSLRHVDQQDKQIFISLICRHFLPDSLS